MDQFWEEFETGDIHFRDKWQFELKSVFTLGDGKKQSEYMQEFYIFIPDALQINSMVYSKTDFFRAETNLIRLQTPTFTFEELLDPSSKQSPFEKLQSQPIDSLEMELKLFANIFRRTLRHDVRYITQSLARIKDSEDVERCKEQISQLIENIKKIKEKFEDQREIILQRSDGVLLQTTCEYIRDIMSISINTFLISLLEEVRHCSSHSSLTSSDQQLTHLLLEEKQYRERNLKEPLQFDQHTSQNESILHQISLLNRFTLDALQLQTSKLGAQDKYGTIIGGVTAAMAMGLYFIAFITQGTVFVINSLPFILVTILLYGIADRIKAGLRKLSYKHLLRWFPDYTTEISLPNDKGVMGTVHESFSFIDKKQVPLEVLDLRNQGFHSYLEMIKRQEQVIYYKKRVLISENQEASHLRALNIIFRLDLNQLLAKASNPYENYSTIDPVTHAIIHTRLPKVYHLNVILKNTYIQEDGSKKVEYKKYRIVADKEGIKRIETPLL